MGEGREGGRKLIYKKAVTLLRVHIQPVKSIKAFTSGSAVLFSEVRILICRRKCKHILVQPTDEIILKSRYGEVHLTNFRTDTVSNWTKMPKQVTCFFTQLVNLAK